MKHIIFLFLIFLPAKNKQTNETSFSKLQKYKIAKNYLLTVHCKLLHYSNIISVSSNMNDNQRS